MNWFKSKSAEAKTLIVFLISVVIAVPLMYLVVSLVLPSLVNTLLISAIGWTAGGAIVGTYIFFRRK